MKKLRSDAIDRKARYCSENRQVYFRRTVGFTMRNIYINFIADNIGIKKFRTLIDENIKELKPQFKKISLIKQEMSKELKSLEKEEKLISKEIEVMENKLRDLEERGSDIEDSIEEITDTFMDKIFEVITGMDLGISSHKRIIESFINRPDGHIGFAIMRDIANKEIEKDQFSLRESRENLSKAELIKQLEEAEEKIENLKLQF